MMKLEPTIIEQSDVTVEVLCGGSGDLVVLVPGLGRSAVDYEPLAQALIGGGFRAAAVNLRGIGGSRGPMDGVNFYDLARDVLLVVERLRGAPAHLVGYTIGNRIVRCAARLQPDMIRSLVLLGSGGKAPPDPEAADAGRRFMESMIGKLALTPSEQLDAARAAYLSPQTEIDESFLEGWSAQQAFPQHAALVATPFDGWWEGGGRPMLVLQGEDDRLAPPANGDILANECGERVRVVNVPAAGHLLLDEQPAVVTNAILDYLRGPR